MEIYLVRIHERPDNTLYVERKPSTTTTDIYTAISHVWGDPSTIQSIPIDGIGPVQLSPGKKNLLSILRRPEICGTGWFWMDLFCIDQSPDSPISISDQLMAIPEVYKSSQMVKILIESPVCTTWAQTASRVVDEGVNDIATFNEEELRHSRKCPNLLLLDPWFERLWTRQEGLYGMKLRLVILNFVPCVRLTTSRGQGDRWVAEGTAALKRSAVDTFIADKLAYHGISTKRSIEFEFYLNLVYKSHVDVGSYGGVIGPHSNYSPFGEAWRSGRQTTKARDYVLAVFPDIEGYRAPANARRLSFQQLLLDGFKQLMGQDRYRGFYFLPKIPSSMMTAATTNGSRPWILEDPATTTEAFDSFLGVKASRVDFPFAAYSNTKVFIVAPSVKIERIAFTREMIPEIVKLWEDTADAVRSMTYAAPSGPCTGSTRAMQTHEDLLYRYLGHQFARQAVAEYCSQERFESLRPHGIVNLEKLELSDDTFERELKRFLVCLVCGTTLRCASMILEAVEVVAVRTSTADKGKMLALVNRGFVNAEGVDLMLVSNGFEDYQGLQVAVKREDGRSCFVVGRTVIPNFQAMQDDGTEVLLQF